jgi:hypothetical protein
VPWLRAHCLLDLHPTAATTYLGKNRAEIAGSQAIVNFATSLGNAVLQTRRGVDVDALIARYVPIGAQVRILSGSLLAEQCVRILLTTGGALSCFSLLLRLARVERRISVSLQLDAAISHSLCVEHFSARTDTCMWITPPDTSRHYNNRRAGAASSSGASGASGSNAVFVEDPLPGVIVNRLTVTKSVAVQRAVPRKRSGESAEVVDTRRYKSLRKWMSAILKCLDGMFFYVLCGCVGKAFMCPTWVSVCGLRVGMDGHKRLCLHVRT